MKLPQQLITALRKDSEKRTASDMDLITSFCQLFPKSRELSLSVDFIRAVELVEFPENLTLSFGGINRDKWHMIVNGKGQLLKECDAVVVSDGDCLGVGEIEGNVKCITIIQALTVDQSLVDSILSAKHSDTSEWESIFRRKLVDKGEKIENEVNILVRKYEKGAVILKQGEASDGIYFIEKGNASVMRSLSLPFQDGEKIALVEIDKAFPGDMFGMRSVCLRTDETESLVAMSSMSVLFVSIEELYEKTDIFHMLDRLESPYPSDSVLRADWKEQENWNAFKKKNTKSIMKRSRDKHALGLDY